MAELIGPLKSTTDPRNTHNWINLEARKQPSGISFVMLLLLLGFLGLKENLDDDCAAAGVLIDRAREKRGLLGRCRTSTAS
mmetsp:Transcript_10001/g.13211  ORF Transcript_10001/g.13211 Transcript_10001/m.13211 type:complete len:81 (-) Transcript_10001:285-527(-)